MSYKTNLRSLQRRRRGTRCRCLLVARSIASLRRLVWLTPGSPGTRPGDAGGCRAVHSGAALPDHRRRGRRSADRSGPTSSREARRCLSDRRRSALDGGRSVEGRTRRAKRCRWEARRDGRPACVHRCRRRTRSGCVRRPARSTGSRRRCFRRRRTSARCSVLFSPDSYQSTANYDLLLVIDYNH